MKRKGPTCIECTVTREMGSGGSKEVDPPSQNSNKNEPPPLLGKNIPPFTSNPNLYLTPTLTRKDEVSNIKSFKKDRRNNNHDACCVEISVAPGFDKVSCFCLSLSFAYPF
jgi:hypothetical protein